MRALKPEGSRNPPWEGRVRAKYEEISPTRSISSIWSGVMPAAYSIPIIEPMELDTMKSGTIPCSSKYLSTPIWAQALALPPVRTRPIGSLFPSVLWSILSLKDSSPYVTGISEIKISFRNSSFSTADSRSVANIERHIADSISRIKISFFMPRFYSCFQNPSMSP